MTAALSVERLTHSTPETAAALGRLMPYLSDSFSDEPISQSLLQTIIDSPHHEQLVARLDGHIVGCATLSLIIGVGAGQKGWLEDFVADPDAGVRGIGQALWDEMTIWCKEQGVNLHFTSHPRREAAHRFYHKNGAAVRHTTVFEKDFTS